MTVGVVEFIANATCFVGRCAVQCGLLGGLIHETVNLGLKSGWLIEK